MIQNTDLTTAQVLTVFEQEVAARGGSVIDTFHDGQRLFSRSVLPQLDEVRPGDSLQAGIAVKATDQGIWLYPYTFRLVCRNGAIIADATGEQFLGELLEEEPERAIRDAIEECCSPAAFSGTISRMRAASTTQVDLALALLPLVSRLARSANADLLSLIMDQFMREGDQSQFGLANAITAVARDTADPEVRWKLEEFGGGVALGILPKQPVVSNAAWHREPATVA